MKEFHKWERSKTAGAAKGENALPITGVKDKVDTQPPIDQAGGSQLATFNLQPATG
jgi:hypothetical protein